MFCKGDLDITSYKLSDFTFYHTGADIVVTYKDKGKEKIDNEEIGSKSTGRLAVLQKQKGKWMIANLDSIK